MAKKKSPPLPLPLRLEHLHLDNPPHGSRPPALERLRPAAASSDDYVRLLRPPPAADPAHASAITLSLGPSPAGGEEEKEEGRLSAAVSRLSHPAAPVSRPTPLDAATTEMTACTTAPEDPPRRHQAQLPDLLWRTMASATPCFSSPLQDKGLEEAVVGVKDRTARGEQRGFLVSAARGAGCLRSDWRLQAGRAAAAVHGKEGEQFCDGLLGVYLVATEDEVIMIAIVEFSQI